MNNISNQTTPYALPISLMHDDQKLDFRANKLSCSDSESICDASEDN